PIKKTKLFDILRTVLSIDSQNIDQSCEPIITSYKVEEIKKAQANNHSNLKILIVEDNIINQLVTKKMLQKITKKIRELEKESGEHVPIIALTANAMKGDRERYLACGTDEYLSKPLKKENLIKAMKSLGLI
ncbi:MAG: response regulator, partial [Desulfobacteraceae bacterium]|nr:response regulator [Desulfobacteraceae bacterium]